MQRKFLERFRTVERKITLAELVSLRQKRDESALDFIKRWCDLSMRCDHPPVQEEAVQLCKKGLKLEVSEKLIGENVKTFDHLNSTILKIEMFFADNPTLI